MAHIALIGAETEENLALRYIQSSLEHEGHSVTIIPFNSRHDIDRVSGIISASRAHIAGLSMVFTARANEFADLARAARKAGFTGHITAGGHFAAFNAEELLDNNKAIDSVSIGEGELIMCSLAANLQDLSLVDGLVWRDDNGGIVKNRQCIPPADLDILPFPTHKDPADTYHGMPVANILSSRGCGSSCSFCSISAWHRLCGGKRFRMRSPEKIAEEMALLWNRGYRIFNFHDDNFVLKDTGAMKERMTALQDALEKQGVGRIAFAVKCRADSVDTGVFALMREMGLFRVFVGIEAGTDTSLQALGRGHSVNDNMKALKTLNSSGLQVCFNLILLNPDSTIDDLSRNVSFLRSFPRNPMNFCRAEVYAGTPLEQKLRAEGRLMGDYTGYDYRIADEKAQLAFELMTRILYERHHSQGNMHHASMILDYEQIIKSHFSGNDKAVENRARGFIMRVNTDSCSRLESIIRYSDKHSGSRGAHESFIEKNLRSVQKADIKFRGEYESLLGEIRGTRQAGTTVYACFKKIAAFAGIAAAVSAAAPACAQETHMCETVPDYYYNGWMDDSTYTTWGTSVADPADHNKPHKREIAKRNAIVNAKINIIRNFFGVELKDETELNRFKPDDATGKEVMRAIMNGSVYKITWDGDDNCEIIYRITLPDLRNKVVEIHSRAGK